MKPTCWLQQLSILHSGVSSLLLFVVVDLDLADVIELPRLSNTYNHHLTQVTPTQLNLLSRKCYGAVRILSSGFVS